MNAKGIVVGAFPTHRQQAFKHHASLRFYRMSQCARDLFNAYRNAYLALECLVSDVNPKKPNERELDWLKRVIGGPLRQAVPSGLEVDSTLKEIYKHGRNPLFHAKTGATFYPPHGMEREEVQSRFERLTLLLVSLLQHHLGTEVVRRWATMSQAARDAQTQSMFDFDKVCFEHGSSEIFVTPAIEVIESPRRFGHLWAKVLVLRPSDPLSMKKVQFLHQSRMWMQFELEEAVEMSKVASVTFEINSANRNLHAPRTLHPA